MENVRNVFFPDTAYMRSRCKMHNHTEYYSIYNWFYLHSSNIHYLSLLYNLTTILNNTHHRINSINNCRYYINDNNNIFMTWFIQ